MEEELAAYFDASLEEDESARRQAEEWLYQVRAQSNITDVCFSAKAFCTAQVEL